MQSWMSSKGRDACKQDAMIISSSRVSNSVPGLIAFWHMGPENLFPKNDQREEMLNLEDVEFVPFVSKYEMCVKALRLKPICVIF